MYDPLNRAFTMTFSDLQRHANIAILLKCHFSHTCAAVDKISTDSSPRGLSAIAVPLIGKCTCATTHFRVYA